METLKIYVVVMYFGIIYSESEVREVKERNPQKIKAGLSKGAFAFYFYDQVSKVVTVDGEQQTVFGQRKNISGVYYPDAVGTYDLKGIKKLLGNNSVLIDSMRANGWGLVVKTKLGNLQPFLENDRLI